MSFTGGALCAIAMASIVASPQQCRCEQQLPVLLWIVAASAVSVATMTVPIVMALCTANGATAPAIAAHTHDATETDDEVWAVADPPPQPSVPQQHGRCQHLATTRQGSNGVYKIVKCKNCGLLLSRTAVGA